MHSILIQNTSMVLPDRVMKGDLLLQDGTISQISPHIAPRQGWELISGTGKYLLPGFIDIHNHGAKGFDVSLGSYQADKDSFDLEKEKFHSGLKAALAYYRAHGTTRVYPTSLAASLEDLTQAFSLLSHCLDSSHFPNRDLVAGINLEGTFLKLPEYAGAQNPTYFYPASLATFERLQAASAGRLSIVNIPPEHGEEGLRLTRFLAHQGIVVAGGHTGAEADQFGLAVDAGLKLAVHFFNGPSRSSSKSFHDGGAEEAILRRDEVFTELIVDGYHIHPAYVRDTIARKEPSRVILITDSMFVNGSLTIQDFSLGGIPGTVSANREYLQVRNKADTLFGSVLCPDKGVENVLNWLTQEMTGMWYRKHEALSLNDALVQISQMASSNPARLLNIFEQEKSNSPGTGSIEVGKWGDLVLASISLQEPHPYTLQVERVWVKGHLD